MSQHTPHMPHDGRTGRIAIIDIGSNSVRLVIYDQLKRAPAALYNEKVLCQLGKGLALTGRLNPEGVTLAHGAFARYLAMARAMEVTSLDIFATAAVRDAKDGPDFVEELEKRHHVRIEVISGKREARLGAYGILASVHKPSGISGDLGGGSLELAQLQEHHLTEQSTLPIGSLRLVDQAGADRVKMRALVTEALAQVDWLKRSKPHAFYAIGGSLRSLARMYMIGTDYPLQIVHQYAVPSKDLSAFLQDLLATPDEKLAALPGSVPKRLSTLIPAALILEQVIAIAKPQQVVFSASGVREGYLFEKLSPYLREEDVLLASCTEFAVKGGRGIAYAAELCEWMKPLFPKESEAESRLRFAACLLHDIARYIHPDHRAEWAMWRILQSNLTGLEHSERVQVSLAMYHRYQFRLKGDSPVVPLIGERERAWAWLFGAAANLAYHLSGGVPGTLLQTGLTPGKNKITLQLPEHLQALMGESVKKRIGGVEEAWQAYR